MDLIDFLTARLYEDEANASRWAMLAVNPATGLPGYLAMRSRILAEVEAKRETLKWHQNWPVLVQGPDVFEPPLRATVDSLTEIAMRVSRQMEWLTAREYVAKFGEQAPTTPILRALARIYEFHPDFDPAWKD